MPRGVYRRTQAKQDGRTDGRTDGVSLVSAVDWPAMLAQLEHQRAAIDEERADIDAVIETIRRRAGPAVTIAAIQQTQRAPTRTGGKKNAKARPAINGTPKHRRGLTDDQLATMRAEYERGVDLAAIGARFGISGEGVKYHGKRRKWKRPKAGAVAKPAAAAPAASPAGTQLSGSVRCTNPECGSWTDFDPCRSCGKTLKRNKW